MTKSSFQRSALLLVSLAVGAFSARTAEAAEVRGFGIDRFEPSEAGSRWFTLDSLDYEGNLRPAVRLVGDWNHEPQRLYGIDGGHHALVSHQLSLHLGASLTFLDRFRLGVSMPFYASQKGETIERFDGTYVGPNGAAFGDLRVGAEARFFGEPKGPLRLGAGLRFWAPTGSPEKYTGDGKYKLEPHVDVAGGVAMVEYAAKVGYLRRGRHQSFVLTPIGDEVSFALSAGVRLLDDRLLLGAELDGAIAVSDTGDIPDESTVFASVLLGARYSIADFRFGLGAGPGLSHAAGTPRFRGLASVEWLPLGF